MGLEAFFVNIDCSKIYKQCANIPNTVVCSLIFNSAVLTWKT